ncbi:YFR022W [Saccharomyces arboricola H-6]|uniref:YFR022W n=1 Tax=Saccharomyces arboricola (strain H-6 / AS 2.3317 / CBS 10644) TaxID=1160507 RepID=J8Q5I4_SACAR|nr:YFR022W [Saccharomyces arboricola H-6]
MCFNSSKSSKKPLLFDIRLNDVDNDVILLKGPSHEAPSVLLSGWIVLSISEPMQIKSISLRLSGRIKIDVPLEKAQDLNSSSSSSSTPPKVRKYNKEFYSHAWDNVNLKDYLRGQSSLIGCSSSSNISDIHQRVHSTSSLKSLKGSSTPSSHTLGKGNYDFPFSAILPGSLPESVESLPNCFVTYCLESAIERGKYDSDLTCRKNFRILRTISPAAIELSETVCVDNSWPNKVDYSISVPNKAIAIGSATPINISIIPLSKGLKLGPIKILLLENYQYCDPFPPVISENRQVTELNLENPLNESSDEFNADDRYVNNPFFETDHSFQDKWEINTILQIPNNLSNCVQDCDVRSNIKVRHKLKFSIMLINPDGHKSELRASLLIQLFISPFVTLSIKPLSLSNLYSLPGTTNKKDSNLQQEDEEEEYLFSRSASATGLGLLADMRNGTAVPTVSDLMTPPNYEMHVYDRLYSGCSNPAPVESSGTCTPLGSECSTIDDQQDLEDLRIRLTSIRNQRENLGLPTSASSAAVSRSLSPLLNVPGQEDGTGGSSPQSALGSNNSLTTGIHNNVSPVLLSRSPAATISVLEVVPVPTGLSYQEAQNLNEVPSYGKAMKYDIIGEDLPPGYPCTIQNMQPRKPSRVHSRASSATLSSSFPTSFHSSSFMSNTASPISMAYGSRSSSSGVSLNTLNELASKTSNNPSINSIKRSPTRRRATSLAGFMGGILSKGNKR